MSASCTNVTVSSMMQAATLESEVSELQASVAQYEGLVAEYKSQVRWPNRSPHVTCTLSYRLSLVPELFCFQNHKRSENGNRKVWEQASTGWLGVMKS